MPRLNHSGNPIMSLIDKSEWGDGPWQDEPDLAWWGLGSMTGLVQRVEFSGSLCGYVVLPPKHRLSGTPARDLEHMRVHGGVTWSGSLVELGEFDMAPAQSWVIGFNASHHCDYLPAYALNAGLNPIGDPKDYKDMAYMRRQVIRLAAQCTGSPVMTIKVG